MPRIFDNIEQHLLPALRETIQVAGPFEFSRHALRRAVASLRRTEVSMFR